MRRSPVLLAVLAVALVGLVAPGRPRGGTVAQEGTPTAVPEAAGGVTLEVLGAAPPAPGQALTLLRLVLTPGASLPLHTNPGPTVAYVEAGALGVAALTGVAEVARVLTPGTPGALPPATPGPGATPALERAALVLGAEAVLVPGDSVAFGPDLVHGLRNAGTGPTIVLMTGIYADDEPPFRFVEADAGTPAP